MARRVVVTGAGGITAFGEDWDTIKERFLLGKNAVKYMKEWEYFKGLNTKLAVPIENFELPAHYTRKKIRSMGRVSLLATRATEKALENAGLLGNEVITNGQTGIAFGSCFGSTQPVVAYAKMLDGGDTSRISGTTYVQLMPHTTAVNAGLFFGVTGRVIPTSSACTSGSQAIGYAYEAIKFGMQDVMIAGGAEELCPSMAASFDTLFATSTLNEKPEETPKPFDKKRDGLVVGEGAGALILEELEHAKNRGANILAEVVGFASNCDATHITQPKKETIQICIANALKNAQLKAEDIGYISAHGTSTSRGDIAESLATEAIFGTGTPISSIKSYLGHTLGACGALEAWFAIQMMNEGWFAHTANLEEPDENCGRLDYIMNEPRRLDTNYIMSNNFAFGGVNTSLIFKRFSA